MRKIKINFEFDGVKEQRIAVFADDWSYPIPHEDNEANGVVDGVADELGIWSIYFDNYQTEADFVCEIDDDGYEQKTLTPAEIWLWGRGGKTVPFTITEI